MNTKEKILDVALELFSQKGFTAVSIRDICKIVGVKESAIYYFFKNKKAVLDALLQKFLALNETYMGQLQQSVSPTATVTREDFLSITGHYVEDYLMDPFVNSFLKILSIEQFHSEELRKLSQKVLYDDPVQFQSILFDFLIRCRYLKNADPTCLAVSFYASTLYYYQKYLLANALTENNKTAAREAIKSHTIFFLNQYSEVQDA